MQSKQKLVLVLNCGSSSIKFAVVNPETAANVLSGLVQCIEQENASLTLKRSDQKTVEELPNISYQHALEKILHLIDADKDMHQSLVAVGHRVVHGGEHFTKSVVIDDKVLQAIRDCATLAPLHNPANIMGIEVARKALPKLTQVAVFDTAFHQTIPEYAYMYAIPRKLYAQYKIRRYGFHGTSHRFVSEEAAKLINKPLNECNFVTAHLGNGCSVCAIAKGQSVDTSMGLTPLEGLVMGTRSGDVDPSLHMHLAKTLGYDIKQIDALLNKQSGLLGVSSLSSDMRTIEAAIEQSDKNAELAADIFCYRLAKYIAAYAVILEQIDALIFTGGIGENSPFIRAKVLQKLQALNFHLATEHNETGGKTNNHIISKPNSTLCLVIPTNEELMIAQDAVALKR